MKIQRLTLQVAMTTVPLVGLLLMTSIVMLKFELLLIGLGTAIAGVLIVFVLLVIEEVLKLRQQDEDSIGNQ